MLEKFLLLFLDCTKEERYRNSQRAAERVSYFAIPHCHLRHWSIAQGCRSSNVFTTTWNGRRHYIVIDDDNVYGPSMVDSYTYFSLKYPDAVFTANPFDPITTFGFPSVKAIDDHCSDRATSSRVFLGMLQE